jgi:hypothetical protein
MSIISKFAQVVALSSFVFGSFASSAISAPAPQNAGRQMLQGQTLIAQVIDKNGEFSVDSRGCQRRGTNVTCDVIVTNLKENNLNITFYADDYGRSNTYAVDSNGNQYMAKLVRISKSESRNYVGNTYIPNIPVKVNFVFELPEQVNQLAAFSILYNYNSTITLRNVPIVSSKPNTEPSTKPVPNTGNSGTCTCPKKK